MKLGGLVCTSFWYVYDWKSILKWLLLFTEIQVWIIILLQLFLHLVLHNLHKYNIEFKVIRKKGHASKVLTCLSFRNVVVWRFHIFSHSMQCAAAIFCLNKCYIHNSCKHSTISLTLHEKKLMSKQKFLIEFKKICMNWAIN